MSTKSYTLADGTAATVNATANGVPFNEGMQVLTKAIKAKVNAGTTLTAVAHGAVEGHTIRTFPIENGIRIYFYMWQIEDESAFDYIDVTY